MNDQQSGTLSLRILQIVLYREIAIAMQVVCHGIPDRRPLQDGDIVNVDVPAYYKGYHGDLNETFVVGTVDDDSKRLIRTTLEVSVLYLCASSSLHRVLALLRLALRQHRSG